MIIIIIMYSIKYAACGIYKMRIIFLGTAGTQPTASRGLSCTCIEIDGEIIMFDAGEGSQMAYVKAKLGWNKKMRIFITHLHGDHCIGILGILQTMSMQHRTEPLEIFGPAGIDEFVNANIRMLNFKPPFEITTNTVKPGKVVARDNNGKYEISACRASHTISTLSYMLRERNRPGKFNTKNAKKLKVPRGELWGRLQQGHSITIDGQTVRPEQVLGKERAGRTVGISGDTMPSAELEEFFAGCDYLIFDATFVDEHQQRAAETRHSTASQAASLARTAGVKNLILTHFSARYADDAKHLAQAQKIHPSVVAAADLLEIPIT